MSGRVGCSRRWSVELISRLSRLGGMDVIARTSVTQYKGTKKSIADIGRDQDRWSDVIWIKSAPEYDWLRSDPRFQAFLRKMKLD